MSGGSEDAAAHEAPVVEVLPPVQDSAWPEPTTPERIGRYKLCFELASGGMATVYLAKVDGAPGFEKLVALKRIHRHLAKEKRYVDMFLDEARIASRITHPNVCSVFDFGHADGEYYIAMEYLVGEPLSRLCGKVARDAKQRSHPLLPIRMARVIADACEGLHAAHELRDANGELLRVVHRDISPSNLFVTFDGSVQVVDFGIASARQRIHHTSTGHMKGTFAYMAPEQLAAKPIDRRVDIWSLGVSLWEMLALKRLFRRDTTANAVHAILYDNLVPPSVHRPQVPKELDAIVMKALQRDPNNRWQTTREMGRALREYLGAQPAVVGPAELSEWMDAVFPEGAVRKSQLMEVARMAPAPVPTIPRSGNNDDTLTATNFLTEPSPGLHGQWRPSKRALVWAAVAGTLGLVIAAALGLYDKRPVAEPQSTLVLAAPALAAPEPVVEDASDEGDTFETSETAEPSESVAKVRKAPRPRSRPAAKAGP
ncbi:MAG: serine/threonine protein kinase, partial [Deltaproteobacteria bacterium]|nr:serine/threonine protein kinase [Deltaproteobacteria bacterium]